MRYSVDDKEKMYIIKYYDLLGKKVLTANSDLLLFFRLLLSEKNSVLVSDNAFLRAVAKIRRIKHPMIAEAERKATQFFALLDAVSILRQKNVPVYFYNRVGKEKEGYLYNEKETKRMEQKLSFPYMYENISKYESELRDVFGKRYSKEYVEAIGRIPQVIMVGNKYQHEDCRSKYINVVQGRRITCNQPNKSSRTIHFYGRCGAFGYAVEDKDTVPSLLQKKLNDKGETDILVVNHGLWGGDEAFIDHNFLHDSMEMKEGDIVVFYRKHFDKALIAELQKRGMYYKEITHEWHEQRNESVTFFDRPGHMNAEGYGLVAQIISEDLVRSGLKCSEESSDIIVENGKCLNNYIKTKSSNGFENEVKEFINNIIEKYPFLASSRNNGAIVMNCNPFTRGHRFLIEEASKQVDNLIVFVVEEDKSFFKFSERFEMVKNGTKDICNVVVIPSGHFIISAFTFPEYFMKDYVKEKDFDVSMDVETFCKYIAPPLGIVKRFAGEEPFDPVTKNYNENMSKLLPDYNMIFVEIPRYTLDSGEVISATKVREYLKNGNIEELKKYIPDTTYEILVKKYVQ